MMAFLAVLAASEIAMAIIAVIVIVACTLGERRHAYDGLVDRRVLAPLRERLATTRRMQNRPARER